MRVSLLLLSSGLLGVSLLSIDRLSASAVQDPTSPAPERRVIRVTAERFAFSPSEIEVDEGEEVELQIRSDDTAHGFRIVGTDIKVVIPKRGKGDVRLAFKPERTGRYEFECARMCGSGHDFMRGVIRVRSKGERDGR
jgi:cytochrome c oxidase subunit 2